MYKLTVTCATTDELQEVVNKLSGVELTASTEAETAGVAAAPAPAKKPTPTAKAAAATKGGFKGKPAAAPAKAKKAAPTVEELKAHILEHAGDGEDAASNVKDYVATFDVKKISDMDDAVRQAAFDGAEAYFASLGGEGEEGGEEDPMA